MHCYECGNCQTDSLTYYCMGKDDFVIRENVVREKVRSGWKKDQREYDEYENFRKQERNKRRSLERIG